MGKEHIKKTADASHIKKTADASHIKKTAEDFTLTEFIKHFAALNEAGKNATLKHKELYPAPKGQKDGKIVEQQIKGGRRYHAPGTQPECAHCKPIIDNFNEMMMLQTDVFNLTGIQIESLFAAINITRATITMMNNEKEAK